MIYKIQDNECETETLIKLIENIRIGSTLLKAINELAIVEGSKRIKLITTNNNINALGFYQKRGFRTCAIHLNYIKDSRKLKHEIPLVNSNGLPIHDEIELVSILIETTDNA